MPWAPRLFRPALAIRCMADEVSLAAGTWSARRAVPAAPAARGTPVWRAAVKTLDELLDAGNGAARRARIVLSDRFVRYCVIPASAGLARADELAAWARHDFRGEYGAAVDGWRVSVDTDVAGASVAVLVEDELLAALEGVCAKAGLKLESLAPHFAATQSGLAQRMHERDAWFAVLETGHLAAGLLTGGRWRHLLTARLREGAGPVDVPAIVAALAAQSLGLPEAGSVRTLHLATPAGAAPLAQPGGGWAVRRWVDPCAAPG